MIRTKSEQTVEFKCIRNVNGETEMRKILNGEEELYGKGVKMHTNQTWS